VKGALPAEFSLMAACCRWPPSAERDQAVAAAAAAPIDWERFERITAKHRVTALAHDGLRRANIPVPAGVAGRLSDAAVSVGRKALATARETLRLQQTFDAAAIPAVFIKGTSLAILAYGDLGIKQAADIDLLTTPECVLAGRHLLERLGYAPIDFDGLDDSQFVRAAEFTKECLFEHPSLGIAVDLHWRLLENPCLLPEIGALSPTREVEIGDAVVRTLVDDLLFAYLCTHGTMHGWARFKWLADVGAFLSRFDEAEIERLYRAALRHGAGRSPAATLLLCDRLLGLAIPASLRAECSGDRIARALAATALRCMTWRGGEVEFRYLSGVSLAIMFSHFRITSGRRYLWGEVSRRWNSPRDRARLPLPRPLGFLYHLLRVPLWLGRFGRRVFGRLA